MVIAVMGQGEGRINIIRTLFFKISRQLSFVTRNKIFCTFSKGRGKGT